ncbi:hypothetical protein CEUSTIGMA_g13063.t1 [Chlamydomonas eustigma]|uniref:Uncharacterized protein n=1 Tax=Chlamydomonas eustigma TaxID=1157962 RepID=A0A250XRF2_9CHLO|nr:hypothetical protein CEUSTIGMA_g13063.t1 [Chlamydomonas eustigma]|eukprot:GAX85648.1 hypothetical protein CEUSTIGMA_g13063.t1 [Chlamydomonas eustigma]
MQFSASSSQDDLRQSQLPNSAGMNVIPLTASNGPTLDDIYKSIMESKAQRQTESTNLVFGRITNAATQIHGGAANSREALEVPAAHTGDKGDSFVARVLRSRTMEEFDRLMVENQELLFDLVGILPEEQRNQIQELKSEGGPGVQPQQVTALIRTMTLEKIFPNHQQQHGESDRAHAASLMEDGVDHPPYSRPGGSLKRSAMMSGGHTNISLPMRGEGALDVGMMAAVAGVRVGGSHSSSIKGQNSPDRQEPHFKFGRYEPSGEEVREEAGLKDLPRSFSHLADLAEVAAAVEDADRQQREREEGQGREREKHIAQLFQLQQQSNHLDMQAVLALQTQAERLASENGAMQSCLEILQRHLFDIQAENQGMKVQLLQTCAASGIMADIHQLEQTISMHRPQPVPDEQAEMFAADALRGNKGSASGTLHQLILSTISQSSCIRASSSLPQSQNYSYPPTAVPMDQFSNLSPAFLVHQQQQPLPLPTSNAVNQVTDSTQRQESHHHVQHNSNNNINALQALHNQLQRQGSGITAAMLTANGQLLGGLSSAQVQHGMNVSLQRQGSGSLGLALGGGTGILQLGQQSTVGALSQVLLQQKNAYRDERG